MLTSFDFNRMLRYMRSPANTDQDCVDRLTLIIEGLLAVSGECAEAHYEPDCCQCQNAIVIRRLREERDDWLGDMGVDRAMLKLMREAHEENLVWDAEQANYDWAFESA